jgi:ADP-heptose:LPS heptosyltransferase
VSPRPPVAIALRAAGIGDLLTAVPALRALAAGLPEHRVLVGAPAWLAELVALVPGVAGHVPVDGVGRVPDAGAPDAPRPDLAVNLHGRGPQSHEVLLRLRPGRLLAYRCPPRWAHGPKWVDDEHERVRWCRLLESAGLAADPAALGLHRPTTTAPVVDAAVVHVGGKDGRKRIGVAAATAVASALAQRGHPVVVTGDAGDRSAADQVARDAGLPPTAVLAGSTGLAALAALVAAARVVVSGDTGAAHLASAYGVASVVLFGPEPPERWGPPTRVQHRVLHGAEGDASALPGDRVVEAVLDVLAVTDDARRPPGDRPPRFDAPGRGIPAPGARTA